MKYFILIIFQGISLLTYCQNIYSLENRLNYANYLVKNNDFKKALNEINSIESAFPISNEVNILQTHCLLGLNQVSDAYNTILELPLDKSSTQEQLFLTLKCSLLNDNFNNNKLFNIWAEDNPNKELLCYYTYFVNGIDSAIIYAKSNIDDTIQQSFIIDLITQPNIIQYRKKPILAGFLSLIPGMGQFYSLQKTDGFTAASAIVLNGAVAWVTFNQNGLHSILGWVSGTMAVGFYFGNIVGAYKSAVRLNQLKTEMTNYEIKKRISILNF